MDLDRHDHDKRDAPQHVGHDLGKVGEVDKHGILELIAVLEFEGLAEGDEQETELDQHEQQGRPDVLSLVVFTATPDGNDLG